MCTLPWSPARRCAIKHSLRKLIYHHPLEDVGLKVDIASPVPPKDIQNGRIDKEATDAHPQAVRKGGESQGDDEDGENRRHEHDEGFGRDEVEEQPHEEGEEGRGVWAEVTEPVGDDGEEGGDEEEPGQADEEIGN